MRPDAAIQSIFGIPDIKIRRDPSVLLPGIPKPDKTMKLIGSYPLEKGSSGEKSLF
jgi:hypothetical protein